MNKLDYSRALVCDFVRVSNDTRTTRELHAKTNGNYVSMVHASIKLKLSCTICMLIHIKTFVNATFILNAIKMLKMQSLENL